MITATNGQLLLGLHSRCLPIPTHGELVGQGVDQHMRELSCDRSSNGIHRPQQWTSRTGIFGNHHHLHRAVAERAAVILRHADDRGLGLCLELLLEVANDELLQRLI